MTIRDLGSLGALVAAVATVALLGVGSSAGCVAPGSAMGNVSVRGSLRSTSGQGLADREVQLVLPAAYGLGGLDLVLNDPEDFGHQDESFSVRTDANGEFAHDLGTHIYHIGCWLLPPIGCFPKTPPPPFLLVRVPGIAEEYYAVQTADGLFKVFTPDGEELPQSEARLAELTADSESSSDGDMPSTVGIIDLRLQLP